MQSLQGCLIEFILSQVVVLINCAQACQQL